MIYFYHIYIYIYTYIGTPKEKKKSDKPKKTRKPRSKKKTDRPAAPTNETPEQRLLRRLPVLHGWHHLPVRGGQLPWLPAPEDAGLHAGPVRAVLV